MAFCCILWSCSDLLRPHFLNVNGKMEKRHRFKMTLQLWLVILLLRGYQDLFKTALVAKSGHFKAICGGWNASNVTERARPSY